MIKYDSRPSKCPDCGGKVTYGKMADFGIQPYQSGYCYICLACGSYVGTHKNRPKEALGRISDRKTRQLRVKCHNEFDRHWQSTAGKNRLYYKLSKELGIKTEDCHFGYMDYEELRAAYDIMRSWGNFVIK